MVRLLLLAGLAQAQTLYPTRSTEPIVVVWPRENATIPAGSQGMFIFGSVIDAKAPFVINGQTVTAHDNGAFLSYLPVSPGTFTYRLSLFLKEGATDYYRTIIVPAPPPPSDEAVAVEPRADVELQPGDFLTVRVRGKAGQEARWRVGDGDWQPLRELQAGLYEGSKAVVGDELTGDQVQFQVGHGWSASKALSAGRVWRAEPRVAVIKSTTPIRGGPGNGFMLFPLPGTRVLTLGRVGDQVRLQLSPAHEGWAGARELEFTPGAPPPRAVTGAIGTTAAPDATYLKINLTERVPFSVEVADDLRSLTVRLFHAVGHTNWIVYDDKDDFVREVRWRQESAGVVAVTVLLSPGRELWGWNAVFLDGAALRLELRHPPKPGLRGLKVMLDPGHMPSATGATGPMGTLEMDANYAIALEVASLLTKEGAVPMLTRQSAEDEVSLSDRPRLAVERRADLFISIHNNALPDGVDPWANPRGFSVFYYHPQSLELAKALYDSYAKRVALPPEQLRFGDLLVARLPAVPAVLVENAYMLLPEQEAKLNDPKFRKLLAQAVVEGLRSFMAKRKK